MRMSVALCASLLALLIIGGCGGASKPASSGAAGAAGTPITPVVKKKRNLYEAKGGFSYDPPPHWTIKELPGFPYKVAGDAPKNGFAANFNVVDEPYSGNLSSYVTANKETVSKAFQNYKELKQDAFTTESGLECVRLIIEDTQENVRLRQTFFFFDAGSRKFVLTHTALAEDGTTRDEEALASAKTFTLND